MMTISTVRRIKAASGDYSTIDVAGTSISIGSITVKSPAELEAFGNALIDIAHELRGSACVPLDPSAEDVLIRYADEHAGEVAQAGS